MQVAECINNRRSVRSFTEKLVPIELINKLVALGTKAATGSGQQAWGFVVITDKDEMKRLSDAAKSHLAENLDKYPYFAQYKNWIEDENYNIFYNAPGLIIIYGDTTSHWHVYDCTLAAGNIMLAASEQGLGTCWIGFAEQICNANGFKEKYNVANHYTLVSALVVGYPESQLPPPNRKPATIFNCK